MKFMFYCVAFLWVTCLLSNCTGETQYKPSRNEGAPTSTDTAPIYWRNLTQAEKQELERKVAQIKLGDAYSSVVNILGKPDYDSVIKRKERDEFIIRSCRYYLKEREEGIVNYQYDSYINLHFDKNNILVNWHKVNCKEFPNVPGETRFPPERTDGATTYQ